MGNRKYSFIRKKPDREFFLCLLCILSMYLLLFEEPLQDLHFPLPTYFGNILAVAGCVFAILAVSGSDEVLRRRTLPYVIAGGIFLLCGFIGWIMYRYQTLLITADGAFEHLRFFLCLFLFYRIAGGISFRKYAGLLFANTTLLSAFMILLSYYDFFHPTWPRQIYRFGVGSVQLFFRHPSNFGAHCVFLLGMLCFLMPYLEEKAAGRLGKSKVWTARILMILLCGSILMTLRIRLIGFIVFFALLFIYLILLRKNLTAAVGITAFAAAALIGWKRFYWYYFSSDALDMARGQLAVNALRIARRAFPFGSGFGTFATRIAQIHFSPVYYKYNMIYTLGLSPEQSNYACDAYFPALIAETGWLGTAAYTLILLLLFRAVFQIKKNAADARLRFYLTLTAFSLLVYELLEMTGTLAFAEPYSLLIAMVLGFALSEGRSL